MTKSEAITELVRIWHSPHLDLILKARLGEVIDVLKEKNRSDSLVRDDDENCKESESKLDLISRQDAIEVLTETIAPPSVTLDTLVMRIDALPSAEAVQADGDLIRRGDAVALVNRAIRGTDNKEIREYLFDGLRKQMWELPSAELRKVTQESTQDLIPSAEARPTGGADMRGGDSE